MTGKRYHGVTMWNYEESEQGVIEERVTFTARRWKCVEGVVWRQDADAYGCEPWVPEHLHVPLHIQVLLERLVRGQRIDGSAPEVEV
jgi:hypothetical protein